VLRGSTVRLWARALGAALLLAAVESRAQAGFQHIVDSDGLALEDFAFARLNDAGEIVFFAREQSGEAEEEPIEGLFTGPDPATDTFVDTSGPFAAVLGHAVGPDGTVIFLARTEADFGLYSGPDPVADLFVDSASFSGFGGVAGINASGAIAFYGVTGATMTGYFVGPNPATDTLVDNSGPFEGFLSQPVINDAGAVAFVAKLDDGVDEDDNPVVGATGVFGGTDPETDIIASTDDGFLAFTNLSPSINNLGEVVFRGATAFEQGIYRGPDLELDRIADSSGDYGAFGEAAINDAGTVVFLANLDSGGTGIFTGPDPIADAVITTGDSLFGGAVVALDFAGHGALNNHGEVAFVYELDSGVTGVALAPEPGASASAAGLVAALWVCMMASRRPRRGSI